MENAEDITCNYILKAFVPKGNEYYFENEWLPGIYEEMSCHRGFCHRVVISPSKKEIESILDGDLLEFVIILYFKGFDNISSWQSSPERKKWLDKGVERGIQIKDFIDEYGGDHVYYDNPQSRIIYHNTNKDKQIILPPPKWKLFFIIDVGALAAVIATAYARESGKMLSHGFPRASITFFTLCHVVFVIAYVVSPILLSVSFISNWLKRRSRLEDMYPFHRLLDQGLEIFTAPMKEGPPKELLQRLERLEGEVNKLRRVNYELSKELKRVKSAQKPNQLLSNCASSEQSYEISRMEMGQNMAETVSYEIDPEAMLPSGQLVARNGRAGEMKANENLGLDKGTASPKIALVLDASVALVENTQGAISLSPMNIALRLSSENIPLS